MVGLSLKRLPQASLAAALTKAAHYRDLNQPEEAVSICRDVLDVDPANGDAWRLMGLALTDQLQGGPVGLFEQALDAFQHLSDEYDRVYHVGVAWERVAKAHMERSEAHSAVTSFEHALHAFQKAEGLRPASPDPVLRWNRCVRLLSSHPMLKAAIEAPRDDQVRLGD